MQYFPSHLFYEDEFDDPVEQKQPNYEMNEELLDYEHTAMR